MRGGYSDDNDDNDEDPQPMAPITIPHPPRFWRRGDALAWPPQRQESATRTAIDGDTVIRLLTAAVVLAVATFAAVVSYSHIYYLGRHNGQDGVAARLLPLSVDGLIAAASLVMLHAARNSQDVPWLARAMLALGVGATVAANVAYGLPFGVIGSLVSAWPAVAFVGSVEMAVRFVRDARHATGDDGEEDATDDGREAPPETPIGGAEPLPPKPRSKPKAALSAMEKARTAIAASPGLTDKQIARKAGVSVRTVVRAKKKGEAEGMSGDD